MYDFFLYASADQKNGKKVSATGKYVVEKLVEHLSDNQNFKVFLSNSNFKIRSIEKLPTSSR